MGEDNQVQEPNDKHAAFRSQIKQAEALGVSKCRLQTLMSLKLLMNAISDSKGVLIISFFAWKYNGTQEFILNMLKEIT